MSRIPIEQSKELIAIERQRLADTERQLNPWIEFVRTTFDIPFDTIVKAIRESDSFTDFAMRISELQKKPPLMERLCEILTTSEKARDDFNRARKLLGLDVLAPSSDRK